MSIEDYKKEVGLAHTELSAAMAEVMRLTRVGKAFGPAWETAVEREKKRIVEFYEY